MVCIGTISIILFILKKKIGFYGLLVSLFFGILAIIEWLVVEMTTVRTYLTIGSSGPEFTNYYTPQITLPIFLLILSIISVFLIPGSKSVFGIERALPEKIGKRKFFAGIAVLAVLILFIANLSLIAYELSLSGNQALCPFIKEKAACISLAAIGSSDYSKCNALSGADHEGCLSAYAIAKKDGEICEKVSLAIPELNKDGITPIYFAGKSFRDLCFYGIASRTKDQTTCEKISDENLKTGCLADFEK
ncbi:MAG: hypothetical protein NT067_02855 [Candidatus Diapherotrites archaeon]|nr:hypothetical protein [Candidatus Diapherotrites archaeon]